MTVQPQLRFGYTHMATKRVNLDAMIRREDLDVKSKSESATSGEGAIPISDLQQGRLHYGLLRKPDFQRETNDWDVDNVVTLIRNFRDGGLIPAVILWSSTAGYNFVIDGAHRLSAFIAWVNDDYGDGHISRKFFGGRIARQQEEAAKEARARIAAEVGTYSDLSKALNDENPTPQRIRWAANIARHLVTQFVTGNAHTAEQSFLAINQRAVGIEETEKRMIESRRKPNVIAARALVRCGTGHEYWSKFDDQTREAIKSKAKSVYDIIFEPENEDAARSIDLPIAGEAYSADSLRLTLELINFTNNFRRSKEEDLPDDDDGAATLDALSRTYSVVKHMVGRQPQSLGLHSAVYSWGDTGKHNPAAFLATVSFIRALEQESRLVEFCAVRAEFEEFLVAQKQLVKHILGKFGGWTKSVPAILHMYSIIMDGLREGQSEAQIRERLLNEPRFSGLADRIELEASANRKISRETGAAVRRRDLLAAALRCPICHARLPTTSFSQDHRVRVRDGGRGSLENVQLTHPYCNHGFKEYLDAKGIPALPRPAFLAGD